MKCTVCDRQFEMYRAYHFDMYHLYHFQMYHMPQLNQCQLKAASEGLL